MNNFSHIEITNLQAIREICKIKNMPLEDLMNYIVDQYILYFSEMQNSDAESQSKPRRPIKRDRSLMSFKQFINSARTLNGSKEQRQ